MAGVQNRYVLMIALGWAVKATRDRFWIISTRSGYILPHWKFSWSTYAVIFLSRESHSLDGVTAG